MQEGRGQPHLPRTTPGMIWGQPHLPRTTPGMIRSETDKNDFLTLQIFKFISSQDFKKKMCTGINMVTPSLSSHLSGPQHKDSDWPSVRLTHSHWTLDIDCYDWREWLWGIQSGSYQEAEVATGCYRKTALPGLWQESFPSSFFFFFLSSLLFKKIAV